MASFKLGREITPSYIGEDSDISALLSANKLSFAELTLLIKSSSG
jgi:hypothetical protein